MLSGGVASNQYIRKALTIIAETTGLHLLCPPVKFCTDNGVMIAWCVLTYRRSDLFEESSAWNKHKFFFFNQERRWTPERMERDIASECGCELRAEVSLQRILVWFLCPVVWNQPGLTPALCCRAPLGVDLTAEVKAAAIKLPAVRMKILSWQSIGFILSKKTLLCIYSLFTCILNNYLLIHWFLYICWFKTIWNLKLNLMIWGLPWLFFI